MSYIFIFDIFSYVLYYVLYFHILRINKKQKTNLLGSLCILILVYIFLNNFQVSQKEKLFKLELHKIYINLKHRQQN